MLEVAKDFGSIFARWRIWWLMSTQDIQLRYRRSIIGPFWISISLGVLALALGLLYGAIFAQPFREYLAFLSTGLLVWFFLSATMNEGCTSLVESEAHLRNLPVRIPLLAVRTTWRNVVIFGHNLIVVMAILAYCGISISATTAWAIPGFLIVSMFGFGMIMVLGPICLRFRDLAQIVTNLVQLIFFLSPILWAPTTGRVSASFVQANPFYHLIEVVRAPLLGETPTELNWIVSIGAAAAILTLSLVVVSLTRRRIFLWL